MSHAPAGAGAFMALPSIDKDINQDAEHREGGPQRERGDHPPPHAGTRQYGNRIGHYHATGGEEKNERMVLRVVLVERGERPRVGTPDELRWCQPLFWGTSRFCAGPLRRLSRYEPVDISVHRMLHCRDFLSRSMSRIRDSVYMLGCPYGARDTCRHNAKHRYHGPPGRLRGLCPMAPA